MQGKAGRNFLLHLVDRESNGGKGLIGKYDYPASLFLKPNARRMRPSENPDAEQPGRR